MLPDSPYWNLLQTIIDYVKRGMLFIFYISSFSVRCSPYFERNRAKAYQHISPTQPYFTELVKRTSVNSMQEFDWVMVVTLLDHKLLPCENPWSWYYSGIHTNTHTYMCTCKHTHTSTHTPFPSLMFWVLQTQKLHKPLFHCESLENKILK